MKKMTLLSLLAACSIEGVMTPAAGRKAAPMIRVAPDRAVAGIRCVRIMRLRRGTRMRYGHFSGDGTEYIVTRPDTPRPWYNRFGNREYSVVLS